MFRALSTLTSPQIPGHTAVTNLTGSLVAFLAMCVAMCVFVGAVLLLSRHGHGGDDNGDGGGGGGWGRDDRRPSPPDPRPDGEPGWWPDFERQFAAYVKQRTAPVEDGQSTPSS